MVGAGTSFSALGAEFLLKLPLILDPGNIIEVYCATSISRRNM